jgi:polyisoprenyl-phosphate glycosyltransferase
VSAPRSDAFVSVVIPIRDRMDYAAGFVRELHALLERTYANFEVILVDDGCTDGTEKSLRQLLKELDGLRLLRLSRPFGREATILAGLESSIGDYIVVMLPESDPVELVPAMVERCRLGSGVVVGVEENPARQGGFAGFASRCFHWYCRKQLHLNLHPGSRFFRVFSRSALNAILQIRDRVRNLRYLSGVVGFDADPFPYRLQWRVERPPRRRFTRALSEGIGIILANTRHPLRFVTDLGLAASAINLGYVLYSFLARRADPVGERGWSVVSLQLSILFFILFVVLAVLAEYVGLVLWETRSRPAYFVAREEQSNLVKGLVRRRNVVNESR